MTSIATTSSLSTSRAVAGLGVGVALVAATLTTLFAHTWAEAISMVALILMASAVVYGVVVPRGLRREGAAGTALTFAVVAALLIVPAFWTGLPLVLGVAAVVLGNAGRTAPRGGGRSIAALVIGALTSLFYLYIYVSETLSGQLGTLLGW